MQATVLFNLLVRSIHAAQLNQFRAAEPDNEGLRTIRGQQLVSQLLKAGCNCNGTTLPEFTDILKLKAAEYQHDPWFWENCILTSLHCI